jgi:hypothetical protein
MEAILFILLPDALWRRLAPIRRGDISITRRPTLRRTGISDAFRAGKPHARRDPSSDRGEP